MTSCSGDAATALNLARELRAGGFHTLRVKVGEVELELAAVLGPQAASMPTLDKRAPSEKPKSVIGEWGGPAFEAALKETDLVDDEDQPAIRGTPS